MHTVLPPPFLPFHRHAVRCAAAWTLAAASTLVSAQTNMKPGLWELTNKVQTSNGELEKMMAQVQQQMAGLPPAQRKQMEDMMAKQGVSLGANGTSIKACMTQELIDRNAVAAREGDCKMTTTARQGNTLKTAYACTQPKKMTGESEVVFTTPESFTMKSTMDAVEQGKSTRIAIDGSGKWLGSDCGSIKPVALPPAQK